VCADVSDCRGTEEKEKRREIEGVVATGDAIVLQNRRAFFLLVGSLLTTFLLFLLKQNTKEQKGQCPPRDGGEVLCFSGFFSQTTARWIWPICELIPNRAVLTWRLYVSLL
jgi:hypothetical protein